jgi:N-acetylglucosaminyl-diphospho-decaprenol L-rhamnosyltransferase
MNDAGGADLAVVIVSANSAHWLRPCLTTLFAHAGDIDLDVVVVAAGCTDDTVELVEAEFPRARALPVENRGFAYGNNRGVIGTTAPWVLFLNPDTEILEGTFEQLLAELEHRPEVGLVGVRSETASGVEWPTIRRFPTPLRIACEALGSEHVPVHASWMGERVLDPDAYARDTACDWVSGSFMLARREALLAAGLMDERYFLFCEEPDLCLRIKRAGFEVRHLPTMRILHQHEKAFNARMLAQEAHSRAEYMRKQFGPVRSRLGIAALALGYGIRALFGGRDRAQAGEQRRASRAALKMLSGRRPPPFIPQPPTAVAPVARSGDGAARALV